MKNIFIMGLSVIAQIISLQPVWADNVDALFQSVDIQGASYEIDAEAGTGRVKLMLVNQSASDLSVLGIHDQQGGNWYMQAKVTDRKSMELSSIVLAAEESLDFSTSHLQLNTRDILAQGAKSDINLMLLLNTGEVPFLAHVKFIKNSGANR